MENKQEFTHNTSDNKIKGVQYEYDESKKGNINPHDDEVDNENIVNEDETQTTHTWQLMT